LAPVTSSAWILAPSTAKTCLPSVLTMSGSSTPASWTFVPEKSGAASAVARSAEGAEAGAGGGGAPGIAATVGCGAGGGASIGVTTTPARVGTPVRPPVRRALMRA